jgi:organic radical activating enzyme|tara:strand:+ start:449 stop:1654 length:1206 start_codon:yes stop_codon:yes gene_type:complete
MRKDEIRKWLNKKGNNFCAMPFIHMAIESNGAIKPCCMAKKFKDLNIKGKTIKEVYNDPVRLKFIETFKKNEQHPNCSICWNDPHIRSHYSTMSNSIDFTEEVMNSSIIPKHELKWIEIRPGNKCNLKCRICGVHSSSSWTKDAAGLYEPDVKFKDTKAYEWTQACDWQEDPTFWNDVRQLESIEYIHFMGGEPYMSPEHFQLLERLVESNIDTNKVNIVYNTNGTYFPTEENQKLYSNFKNIQIALSIDDINDRFEYQRNLANWKEVESNLINFNKLPGSLYSVFIDPTVSVFNIFYLEEINNRFIELGYDPTDCDHFVFNGPRTVHALPQPIKDIIIEKYKNSNSLWISTSINYMNSKEPDQDTWQEFIKENSQLDILRKENFENIFPEFYKIIKPYYE